jgi:hypothetical protein
MKITKTILDPQYEVHSIHYSDEHDEPQHFTKDGQRIPYIEVEEDYRPAYDFEQGNIKHWYFRYKSEGYRDVHTKFTEFRSRNQFTYSLRALLAVYLDKYIGRFMS